MSGCTAGRNDGVSGMVSQLSVTSRPAFDADWNKILNERGPIKVLFLLVRTSGIYPVFTSVNYANRNRDVKNRRLIRRRRFSAALLRSKLEYVLMNTW